MDEKIFFHKKFVFNWVFRRKVLLFWGTPTQWSQGQQYFITVRKPCWLIFFFNVRLLKPSTTQHLRSIDLAFVLKNWKKISNVYKKLRSIEVADFFITNYFFYVQNFTQEKGSHEVKLNTRGIAEYPAFFIFVNTKLVHKLFKWLISSLIKAFLFASKLFGFVTNGRYLERLANFVAR